MKHELTFHADVGGCEMPYHEFFLYNKKQAPKVLLYLKLTQSPVK